MVAPGLLVIEAALQVSVVKKPLPKTVMTDPLGADEGVRVMCGPLTVKTAVAKSPVLPVTVTMYVPGTAVPVT
jgi:hypothetical protein